MRTLEGWIWFCEKDEDVDWCLLNLEDNVIGVDTETTGLDPTGYGADLRLIQIYSPNNEKCVIFDRWLLSEESQQKISNFLLTPGRLKVFHNAKFDMKFLLHDMGCKIMDDVFCTLIASQLTYCGVSIEDGVYVQHSLAACVMRHFGENLPKDLQTSDWTATYITDEQLIYGARDAKDPVRLREVLKKIIEEQRQILIARIEFDCIAAVVELELTGMLLDKAKWTRLAEKQLIRMTRLETKISNLLCPTPMLFSSMPTFKVSSHDQIKKKFRENNIPVPVNSKPGKETTDSDHLETIKHLHPSIPLLIKYSSIKQYRNAFGLKFLRHINEKDGLIHPDILQNTLLTGRFAYKEPNLQQIPSLRMYRMCFICEDGYVLIISDYSQVELRILSHLSKDENMCKGFNEGADFHRFTASLVFDVEIDKVSPVQRRRAKDLNFGIVYGIGVDHFSESAGISLREGERLMKSYFNAFPGLKYFLDVAGKEGRYQKQSRTIGNRLIKYNFEDWDKKAASKAERNGKNTPAQGTSADITKLALGNLIREFQYNDLIVAKRDLYGDKLPPRLALTVHDEIVSKVPIEIAEDCLNIQTDVMEAAGSRFVTRVPIKVDSKIALSWGEK